MARWTSDYGAIGLMGRPNGGAPKNDYEARFSPMETICLGSRGKRSGVDWCGAMATAGASTVSFRARTIRVAGVGHDA